MRKYSVKVTVDQESRHFGAECPDIGLFVEAETLDGLMALSREIGQEVAALNGIGLHPEDLVFTFYDAVLGRDLIIPPAEAPARRRAAARPPKAALA
jgi:hypothetical protein